MESNLNTNVIYMVQTVVKRALAKGLGRSSSYLTINEAIHKCVAEPISANGAVANLPIPSSTQYPQTSLSRTRSRKTPSISLTWRDSSEIWAEAVEGKKSMIEEEVLPRRIDFAGCPSPSTDVSDGKETDAKTFSNLHLRTIRLFAAMRSVPRGGETGGITVASTIVPQPLRRVNETFPSSV